MSDPSELPGGCLCGNVRYAIAPARIFDAGYCHCSMCRRLTGSPVLAWINVEPKAFQITNGEPAAYQSSQAAERVFCDRCGSQLFSRSADTMAYIALNTGTLDDPRDPRVAPRLHMFSGEQLPWLALSDSLLRYPANQLPHPDLR